MAVAVHFFTTSTFWNHKPIDMSVTFIIVCSQIANFIPFWFRFWQCIRKFYKNRKLTIQLWNAGKYFSKLIPPFILLIDLGNGTKKIGKG